jgi:outer membrane protein OmpA-like peptidoglycan-associated protein
MAGIFPQMTDAQVIPEIKKKEIKNKEPGSDKAWADFQEGLRLYEEGPGTHREALNFFESVHDFLPFHAGINYLIGACYLSTDHQQLALPYLKAAYEFNPEITHDVRFLLGRAYHYNYDFDLARDEYKAFLAGLGKKEAKNVDTLSINNLIDQCRTGADLQQDTVRINMVNLGEKINSEWDDYYPVFSPSGDRLFFTSRRKHLDDVRNIRDNKFNEDVYVSYFNQDSVWEPAQNLGQPINTKLNDAAVMMHPKGDTLYFYRGKKGGGDIFYSVEGGGEWTKPKKVPSAIRSGQHESSFSMTADGQKIFLVSDRDDLSLGGLDIFMAERDGNGDWTEPVNLGPGINSEFDEEGVMISPDATALYFSSNGPASMGGYDVFVARKDAEGWSAPVNLGYPVNTTGDDIFYWPSDSLTAYVSSDRADTHGAMDIYKIVYLPEVIIEEPEIDTPEVVVFETPVIIPDPTFRLNGVIRDAADSAAIMARIEIIDMELNQIVATTISDQASGYYSLNLKHKQTYGVEVDAAGYMFYLDIIETVEGEEPRNMTRDFELKKIKVGEKIVLRHIYFAFNKSELTPESSTELDRVVDFLDKNPVLRIEISGHTDNIGSAGINETLSRARAKSVVDYLVENGIDPSRLEYAGYGFTQPIASNDTEAGRAQNRRVEFKVIE